MRWASHTHSGARRSLPPHLQTYSSGAGEHRARYPVAFRRGSCNVRGWERMSNSVYWFALGVALVGCATHHGDDDGMMGSGSDAMHLEVVIDTPMLHWTD